MNKKIRQAIIRLLTEQLPHPIYGLTMLYWLDDVEWMEPRYYHQN